ncbi:acyltransferase family protein [Streptomyces sp. NPDC095613]|uniref:acyltransferase family protein n=1 Tax=Streptomyces sp. NPDC095613 TaxID=3155540 RepID=UPI00331D8620
MTRNSQAPERPSAGARFRLDVQGLRALAVTLVVLSHAGVGAFAGGYVGVDVFFVISGFLITSLLLRELTATGGLSVRRFYARRALRLLPASTLVAVTALAGSWLFLSKVRFTEYAGDAISSALYTVNFRLALSGTDYLAQDSPPSPFQHFWSLAVEEQFYLVWPPLLLLSRKAAARRRGLLAAPLALLCAVSFGLSVYATAYAPRDAASWAYFGTHTRVWELGAGALLALFLARRERPAGAPGPLRQALAASLTWAGLACVLLAAVLFDADTPFPGYHALLPVLGTVLVLAGGARPTPFGAELLLARRPAVWLGGLSYGWYLWHWPLLVVGPMALGRPASVRLALGLSAVALVLAWGTLRLIENPVRFHTAFRRRPRRAMAFGLGLSAVAASTALVAAAFPPPISSDATAPAVSGTLTSAPGPGARGAELADLVARSGAGLPSNLTPALGEVKKARSAVYRDGCHVPYGPTRSPACVYGDRSSDTVVVLLGDSHAAQWFPALDRLARERGWKLVSLTKASCKVAAVTIVDHRKPYTACDAWRRTAVERIGRLRPALVVVSSSDAGTPARPAGDPVRQWTAGFQDTFRSLTATGTRVAALLDTPWPKVDAVDCAASYPLRLGRCANHLPQAIRDERRQRAERAAAAATGVTVIDPTPWLCDARGNCPVVVGDRFVYRDDSHLAEGYAEALAPVLGDRLPEPVRRKPTS